MSVDIPKAIEYYKKSAEADHIYALLALARIYAEGKGVEQNKDKAVFWYAKVAAQESEIEPSVHENSLRVVIQEAKGYIKENG